MTSFFCSFFDFLHLVLLLSILPPLSLFIRTRRNLHVFDRRVPPHLLSFPFLFFSSPAPASISSLLPPSWEGPPPPPCLQTGRRRIRLLSEALWRGGSGGGGGGGKEGDQISRFQRLSSVCLPPSLLHLFLPPGSLETEWLSREGKHAALPPPLPHLLPPYVQPPRCR